MNENQQKLFMKMIEVIEGGVVTPDELAHVTKSYLDILKDVKAQLSQVEKQGSNLKGEYSKKLEDCIYLLKESELKIQRLITDSRQSSLDEVKIQSRQLYEEIFRIEALIPKFPDLSPYDTKLAELEAKIPVVKEVTLDTSTQVRDKLESLKGDDRLDISAIKGIGKRLAKLTDDIINRAIGILDQRTQFLINKVSNLQAQVNAGGTSSGFQAPTSGLVDSSNTVFVWAIAPKVIVVDGGRSMQATSSDLTVNWTGTTTTTLTIAPNSDIFSPT